MMENCKLKNILKFEYKWKADSLYKVKILMGGGKNRCKRQFYKTDSSISEFNFFHLSEADR